MAQPQQKQLEKSSKEYLLLTPMEQMIDDGLTFDGADAKEQAINMSDFILLRNLFQRLAGNMSRDEQDALLRYIKLCFVADTLQ